MGEGRSPITDDIEVRWQLARLSRAPPKGGVHLDPWPTSENKFRRAATSALYGLLIAALKGAVPHPCHDLGNLDCFVNKAHPNCSFKHTATSLGGYDGVPRLKTARPAATNAARIEPRAPVQHRPEKRE